MLWEYWIARSLPHTRIIIGRAAPPCTLHRFWIKILTPALDEAFGRYQAANQIGARVFAPG